MYNRRHSAFAVASHGKVECRAGNTGNLPRGGLFSLLRSTFQFYSCYDQLISYLLQIWIISFYTIFMHEICSDIVDLKDFCSYLWLFTSKAESRTSWVRFQCGRPWDHLPITHLSFLSVERPAMSKGKHSVSLSLETLFLILLAYIMLIYW